MTPAILSAGERNRREQGFALLELILALAILGMVAGIAYPLVNRLPGPAEIGAKTEEIAALLRTDRNFAIRHRQSVVSRIDLDKGIVASGIGRNFVAIPRGVAIEFVQSSRQATADGGGIRFGPDGRSSGGVITLRRPGFAFRVTVNWLTGGVTVARPAEVARMDG